jgi:microcystin-dependent protein
MATINYISGNINVSMFPTNENPIWFCDKNTGGINIATNGAPMTANTIQMGNLNTSTIVNGILKTNTITSNTSTLKIGDQTNTIELGNANSRINMKGQTISKNGVDMTSPTGSVVAFLGTNDPDGWVICNGVTRTNNSDGRYNTLNSIGIGSGGAGTSNYTPPDFKGAFLRGTGTAGMNGLYVGPNLTRNGGTPNSYQDMGVLQHGHSVSDPGHTHYYETPNELSVQSGSHTQCWVRTRSGFNTGHSYTGISIGTSSVNTQAAYYSNTETRPYNCGVNWILKL